MSCCMKLFKSHKSFNLTPAASIVKRSHQHQRQSFAFTEPKTAQSTTVSTSPSTKLQQTVTDGIATTPPKQPPPSPNHTTLNGSTKSIPEAQKNRSPIQQIKQNNIEHEQKQVSPILKQHELKQQQLPKQQIQTKSPDKIRKIKVKKLSPKLPISSNVTKTINTNNNNSTPTIITKKNEIAAVTLVPLQVSQKNLRAIIATNPKITTLNPNYSPVSLNSLRAPKSPRPQRSNRIVTNSYKELLEDSIIENENKSTSTISSTTTTTKSIERLNNNNNNNNRSNVIASDVDDFTDESKPKVTSGTVASSSSTTTSTNYHSDKDHEKSSDDEAAIRAKQDSGIGSEEINGYDSDKLLPSQYLDSYEDTTNIKSRSSELNPPIEPTNVRKEGVISEPIPIEDGKKVEELQIELFDKDQKSEELITKAISANDFLNNMMDADRLSAVVKAMVLKEYPANSFIINEGEDGNNFYVGAEGEFEVVKSGEIKKTFGPGVVFGELAILYKAKRFASIRATTTAKVWSMERKIFKKIMMRTGVQQRDQNIAFLSSVAVLKGLNTDVLHKIGDLLKREFYATGTTIIRQGDPGDKFYIIRGGKVTVLKRDDKSGENRIVGVLKRGDCFGEQALIHQDKRLASIIADEPGTECLTLDRNAFNNYLGRISELKKKPVDQQIPVIPPKVNIINPEFDHIKLEELDVVGTLGIGGFGRVELVQYKKKDTFALKILKKHEVVNQGQIQHAYCEKEIMAMCDSKFIVKLYKTYRNKKYIYFLMEPCLGGDVWTQLQKYKSFDDKTSKFVTGCVIEAFDYLHSRNIIYRDLKPENLMIDSEGYVKLVDFGFAKQVPPNHKTWTFSGTPEYVAPEIIMNKGHDRSVDYWALGVFIHELLVGKPPFRGKDHMRTYSAILRGIDVVQMSQRIPKSAQNLIKGLCRQTPTDRLGYQKKGILDIKKHSWFDGFDWQRLHNRAMTAPLKRPIKSTTDLSNFQEYQPERDDPPDETSGWDVNF